MLAQILVVFMSLNANADQVVDQKIKDSIPKEAKYRKRQENLRVKLILGASSGATGYFMGGEDSEVFDNGFYIGGLGFGGVTVNGSTYGGQGYGGILFGYRNPKVHPRIEIGPELFIGGGGGSHGGAAGATFVMEPSLVTNFKIVKGFYAGADVGYLWSAGISEFSGWSTGIRLTVRQGEITWFAD